MYVLRKPALARLSCSLLLNEVKYSGTQVCSLSLRLGWPRCRHITFLFTKNFVPKRCQSFGPFLGTESLPKHVPTFWDKSGQRNLTQKCSNILGHFSACLRACVRACCLGACVRACLLAFLPACLLACPSHKILILMIGLRTAVGVGVRCFLTRVLPGFRSLLSGIRQKIRFKACRKESQRRGRRIVSRCAH